MRIQKVQKLTKTNDYRLKQDLGKLFSLPDSEGETLSDYMYQLDTFVPIELPFSFQSLRVVYERFPVLSQVINPTKNSFMINVLAETPGEPVLLSDSNLTGAKSLFVAWLMDDDVSNFLEDVVKKMISPRLHVGTGYGDTVVVVPMTAYSASSI